MGRPGRVKRVAAVAAAASLTLLLAGTPHSPSTGREESRPAPEQLPVPPPEPEALLGLPGPEVRALLGDPGLVRRDIPAEVWQYRDESCVLDLYFYGDPDLSGPVHLDARPRRRGSAGSPPTDAGFLARCLARQAERAATARGVGGAGF